MNLNSFAGAAHPGLKSFYVLRNGLPVFHQEFDPRADQEKNEMLVGGFLSALNSFVQDMDGFGEMQKLFTSNGTKFTFHEQDSILFVACTGKDLDDNLVESFLSSISRKFLQMYSAKLAGTSVIDSRQYENFNGVLHREMTSNLLRVEHRDVEETAAGIRDSSPRLLVPHEEVDRDFYFKGDIPDKVLPLLDGKTSIGGISEKTGIEVYKIHAFVRYMVKMGLVKE